MTFLMNFLIQDNAVTSIEYALIASLIALLIVAGATAVGKKLSVMYGTVASSLP